MSVWLIGALALVTVSVGSHAQDLEPRAYASAPVGLNFLIGGYAYSQGNVGVDPSVPITDTEIKLNSTVLAYVRTLDLWGRSGKVDLVIPYTWDRWQRQTGRPGAHAEGFRIQRSATTALDVALRRAGALLEEFRDYQPDIIIGTSLDVTPPLGKYESDKLVNIGSNRWSFKPEWDFPKPGAR